MTKLAVISQKYDKYYIVDQNPSARSGHAHFLLEALLPCCTPFSSSGGGGGGGGGWWVVCKPILVFSLSLGQAEQFCSEIYLIKVLCTRILAHCFFLGGGTPHSI